MSDVCVVSIRTEADIVTARQEGRSIAKKMGFSTTECTLIATAISEVARNIIEYADEGRVEIAWVLGEGRQGIHIAAIDNGPGIENVALAMTDGYSTGGSLGMGLPGAARLMDSLQLSVTPGGGTTVSMRRWRE